MKTAYINKSKSDDWITPLNLYNKLNKEFNFNFDPCPINNTFNGLEIEWKSKNFVNPPYSQLKLWIEKAYKEYEKGKLVVMLIPARTDTIAFHKYIYNKAEIRFIKGRLKFSNSKNCAPFANMIVIFKK